MRPKGGSRGSLVSRSQLRPDSLPVPNHHGHLRRQDPGKAVFRRFLKRGRSSTLLLFVVCFFLFLLFALFVACVFVVCFAFVVACCLFLALFLCLVKLKNPMQTRAQRFLIK